MPNLLINYQSEVEKILKAFEQLIHYEFIPCTFDDTIIDRNNIREQSDNLLAQKFIVSVCGQIKSGKSTLLNYLLFNGKEILPVDDTPWTAKLTEVRYADEDFANIFFYDTKEWNVLKELTVKEDDGISDINYFDTYLQVELNERAAKGIYENEVIKSQRIIKKRNSLDGLGDYISKEGKYTPFVSHVEIGCNNPFIKDVIIVDTPGLNDPNVFRSQITKQWIDKSNAVIFLMYANEPLGKNDFDFIDKYLCVIPSERILFALSKIDLSSGFDSVRNYVENKLKDDERLRNRNLLQNEKVYAISSMGAIINDKLVNNKELSRNEEFEHKRIDNSIIENHGNLNEFIKGIEEHIMIDKGKAIIDSSKSKVIGYANAKINSIKYSLKQSEEKVFNLNLNLEEVREKIIKIKDARDQIKEIEEKYRKNNLNLTTDIGNQITKKTDIIEKEIEADFSGWLEETDFDVAIKLTTYQLNRILKDKLHSNFEDIIHKAIYSKIADMQEELKSELKNITKSTLNTRWQYVFKPIFSLKDIFDKVNEGFESLKEEELNNLRDRVWGFLNTRQKVSNAGIKSEVGNAINNFIGNEVRELFISSINSQLNSYTNKLFSNINKIYNDFEDQLQSIETNYAGREEELKKTNSEIEKFKNELNQKETKFTEIKQIIGL